jgi:hypothetical protein
MATLNNFQKAFNDISMREFAGYFLTRNMASQVLAIDANANDIQDTGTAAAMLNGKVIMNLTADAALDISNEAPYAAWAASTAYTLGGILSEVTHADTEGITQHLVCISAHTSSAAGAGAALNEPYVGGDWKTYWRELRVWAVDATADSVANGTTKYFLVCALEGGVLRVFKAYHPTTLELRIPAFDPTRYIPIGFITWPNASGGALVLGTDNLATLNAVALYTDLIGPVFPDQSLINKN